MPVYPGALRVHPWLRFPDGDFQVGAGGEAWDGFCRDFHSVAAAGIANTAGFAVTDTEGAETGERYVVSLGEAGLYSLENGIQGSGGLRPG